MTQTQINCFIEVVREGSMSRAANRLYISQPSISKSIALLEEELGFPLLTRGGKRTEPTRAGQLIYDHFIRVKEDFSRTVEQIMAEEGVGAPTVRIGCPDTWDPEKFYDRILGFFERELPGVRLELQCFSLADLIIKLKGRKLDIVMTHDLYDVSQFGVTAISAARSECGIVYSKRAFPDVHSIDDLASSHFLIYDDNLRKRLESTIRDACGESFIPRITAYPSQSAAIFEAARGSGIMFFTDWDRMVRSELFGFLPLGVTLPVKLMVLSEDEKMGRYAKMLASALDD